MTKLSANAIAKLLANIELLDAMKKDAQDAGLSLHTLNLISTTQLLLKLALLKAKGVAESTSNLTLSTPEVKPVESTASALMNSTWVPKPTHIGLVREHWLFIEAERKRGMPTRAIYVNMVAAGTIKDQTYATFRANVRDVKREVQYGMFVPVEPKKN